MSGSRPPTRELLGAEMMRHVKVDAIDVGPADSRPRSNDPSDVLYALAHMWAIDTAEDVELVAAPQGDPTG